MRHGGRNVSHIQGSEAWVWNATSKGDDYQGRARSIYMTNVVTNGCRREMATSVINYLDIKVNITVPC